MRAGLIGATALLALFAGCRSDAPATRDANTAECPVCKHEGDLACLCVHVGPGTPTCQCGGETYYFCSQDCRERFEAKPDLYVARQ